MQRATGYLDWSEFCKFMEFCQKRDTKMAMFCGIATYCGLRMSDILPLKWGDIKGDEMYVREKKTKKLRKIFLHPQLIELCSKLRGDSQDSTPIFLSKFGTVYSKAYINIRLKKLFAESGVKYGGNISSHLFRKTFGRRALSSMEDKDMGLIKLMHVFQHNSPEVTKVYLGLREDEIKSVYMGL